VTGRGLRATRPRSSSDSGEGRRILIIDDSPSARRNIQSVLERIGFSSTDLQVATTAEEAAQIFTQWRPEIIFLDLELRTPTDIQAPGEIPKTPTGADLAFLFLARNPRVKLIICSASNAEGTRVADLAKAHTIQTIVKPIVASKVLEVLTRINAAPAHPAPN
jgi:CheY-like chemotaxis protein